MELKEEEEYEEEEKKRNNSFSNFAETWAVIIRNFIKIVTKISKTL